MKLLPYFVHNIKSSRPISELKELVNAYIQQKRDPLNEFELTEELEFSAVGKNKFLVTSNSFKWLAIDGILNENEGTTNIRLTFRQRIFTTVFQSIILLALLTQAFTNSDDRFIIIPCLLAIYFLNIILFNWRANKAKERLTRILQ